MTSALSGTQRSCCRAAWALTATLGAWLGCQAPERPPLQECGNGIVEPSAAEDCEPVQDAQRCGAVGAGDQACRWVCADEGCPEGFYCGVDAICRRPCLGHEGEPACSAFEALSTDVSIAEIADVSLIDLAGDRRPELVAVEYDRQQNAAVVRVYAFDDGTLRPADPAPAGEFPVLTPLAKGGAFHLIAPRSELPPIPATASGFDGLVSALGPDLGFTEALIQGPTVVQAGPLRLTSLSLPDDLPAEIIAQLGGQNSTHWLVGFAEGSLWQPDGQTLSLPTPGAPDDLAGPTIGQPIDEAFALADGHQASLACGVLVYGYRGQATPHAVNPCDTPATGWTSVPLTWPTLPSGLTLGDGLLLTDLDDDGLADLVVTASDNRIYRARSRGDGTFESPSGELGAFDQGVGFADDTSPSPPVSLGVVDAADYDGDGVVDYLTRSTWITSCTLPDCGTCDTPGYRCDAQAPGFVATPSSVVDFDGDGDGELAVLVRPAEDPFFAPEQWGLQVPRPGDLVLIDNPGRSDWSRRVFPMSGAPRLVASGDLDGDGAGEVFAVLTRETGDELIVVFGGGETTVVVEDLGRIVDAHLQRDAQVLAVVSEDLDGTNRRLTRLTATADRELRSLAKLALEVVPRQFVPGRFDRNDPEGIAVAALGERGGDVLAIHLMTRGAGSFFDASTRRSGITTLVSDSVASRRVVAAAIDLDDDAVDELVVFAPDGAVHTLKVEDADGVPTFRVVAVDAVTETFAGPQWPGHATEDRSASRAMTRDLDGDGDLDVWLMTAEFHPRVVAFENLGDGTIDVAGRSVSQPPTPQLAACEDMDCTVALRAFAPFGGPTDRSLSVSEYAVDVLLASRRALFLWTFDPFDPGTAQQRELVELAVVRGGRLPLSPAGGQVQVAVGDIDGDGVDDVVAAGVNGIRWLNGLAVNP